MKEILKETIQLLEKKQPVVWATIVEHKGSTPRKAAARMLIGANGHNLGTIGGGRFEAEAIRTAGALYQNPGNQLIDVSMTGQEVAESEMICGGLARIFVEYISPQALPTVRKLYECFSGKGDVFFLTRVDQQQQSFDKIHWILAPGEQGTALSELPPAISVEVEKAIECGDIPVRIVDPQGEDFLFLEPLIRSSVLHIFGGGHISLDLAWIAERVGFQVIVIDDRAVFANRERFPMALDVRTVPYKQALKDVELGSDDYVVIVTRGHLYDLDVLREVIGQTPAYIGMIGSRRKRAMIFDQLQKEGVTQKRLDEIHAPIGLAIQAETPAEISVSIMAEMIQVRAAIRRPGKKNWHV